MSDLYSTIRVLCKSGITLDQKLDVEKAVKSLNLDDNDILDVTSYIYALFLNLSKKYEMSSQLRDLLCDKLIDICKDDISLKRIRNTAEFIRSEQSDIDFDHVSEQPLKLVCGTDPFESDGDSDLNGVRYWMPEKPFKTKSTIVTYCIDVEDIIFYCSRAPDRGYANVHHYYEVMSEKLLKTDHSMYIIVGESLFDMVYQRRKEAGLLDKTVILTMNIKDSPYYQYRQLVNGSFDSNRLGYNLKTCKDFEYRALFIIWWTKFKVIEKAMKDNPFDSVNFTWVDFGLMRPDLSYQTSKLLIDALNLNPGDKIRIIGFDTFDKTILEDRKSFYQNTSWSLCAGYMSFPSKLYPEFMKYWNSELMENLLVGYPSSEELIMSMCYWKNPDMFDFVLGDYNDLLLSCCHMCTRYDIISNFFSKSTERGDWGGLFNHGERFIESVDSGKIHMGIEQLLNIYNYILKSYQHIGDSEKGTAKKCADRMAEILSSGSDDIINRSNYISAVCELGIKIYRKQTITFVNDGYVKIMIPLDHKHSNTFSARVNKESLFRQVHTYLIKSNIIDPTKNVIDLGAWIGDNSIPWSKLFSGKIYAIDPSSENCEFIQILKEMNSSDNVIILQTAISESERVLHTHGDLHHTSFVYGNTTDEGSTKVKSTSLDSLCSNGTIENIGYIHLDVEGMEYDVVKGAKSLIEIYRPVFSYEVHLQSDVHVDDLRKYFLGLNYKLFMINEVLFGCHSDCRNILAIPSEKIGDFFMEKYIKNLNVLNDISYCVISHQDYMCHPEYFESYDSGKSLYDRYNGGSKATIFVKILDHGVFNEVVILEKYGMTRYTEECDNFIRKRFSTNSKLFNNLIPIT